MCGSQRQTGKNSSGSSGWLCASPLVSLIQYIHFYLHFLKTLLLKEVGGKEGRREGGREGISITQSKHIETKHSENSGEVTNGVGMLSPWAWGRFLAQASHYYSENPPPIHSQQEIVNAQGVPRTLTKLSLTRDKQYLGISDFWFHWFRSMISHYYHMYK